LWGFGMRVTASILYNLVRCPQRVALDAFGDPAIREAVNPFVRLLWERGTLYEREVFLKLNEAVDLSGFEGEAREQQTREALARGEPLIYAGRLGADDLLGMPDLVRKVDGGYIPGDIRAAAAEEGASDDDDGRPKLHYAVQLALYVDLLERYGLSAGRRGFILDIHGDEVPYDLNEQQSAGNPNTYWDRYEAALTEARAILARETVPQAAYGAVCKLCHWHDACIDQLTQADDLTLIPDLGRSVRDVMQDRIPSIAKLASIDPAEFIHGKKTAFQRVGPERLRLFQARAAMLKQAEPRPFLRATVSLAVRPTELFFDVEVDPLRDICYLHGIVDRLEGQNDSERFVSFFCEEPTAVAEREAFALAMAYLGGQVDSVIYHYSKYERTIYRKLQAKYPDVCSVDEVESLFEPPRAVDLYFDVVQKATEWPTRDHSLKTLATYLGFEWRDKHPSGAASIEWFERWVRDRDQAVRQRIFDYNEDDCRATRVLLDGIRAMAAGPSEALPLFP
jgi:predicted RecB family nuclease